jgi:hypothetical protein
MGPKNLRKSKDKTLTPQAKFRAKNENAFQLYN